MKDKSHNFLFFFLCEHRVVLFSLLLCATALAGSAATNPSPTHSHGFSYFHEQVREMPWSIHVMKIELGRTNLELHTTLGHGATLGMGLVSEQAASVPAKMGKPVAAINGDFFRRNRGYPGDPEGLQIRDGELVSAPWPTRICMWIDATGTPHRSNVISGFKATWPDGTITPFGLNEERDSDDAVLYTAIVGRSSRTYGGTDLVLERDGDKPWLPLRPGQTYSAKVREVKTGGDAPLGRDVMVLSVGPRVSPRVPKVAPGAILQISTATIPDLTGAKTAIGGGPTLVRGGRAGGWSGFQMRHPRAAIGWNKEYFFMVEVDGRQRGLSVGMTFSELANYMIQLGCTEAMNFDGGGSATLWVLGNVINSPSEGWERPSANALVLVQKPK